MEVHPDRVELLEQRGISDPALLHIVMALREGLQDGPADDALYGEALSTAVAVYILLKYGGIAAGLHYANGGLSREKLMRAIEYIQDQLESGLTVSGIARAVVPHAFVVRSPRLQLLTLFTPGGLEAAFRGESSPAQNLDLPTGAITYSMVELEKKRTPIQCIRCALPDLG